LAPRLLAATRNFGAGFLSPATLATSRHVSHDRLMHQVLVEVFAKSVIGYRDGSRCALTVGNSKLHRLIPLSLYCGADDHITARSAGNGAFDQQQVALDIDTNNLEVLHSDTLCTHVTSHFLTLENPARGLVLTDGTRRAVRQRVAVGGILHAEVPALDHTLKAFAL